MTSLKYYYLCIVLLFPAKNFAQNFIGMSASNYGGTLATNLNPAEAADSRYKIFLHLGGAGLNISNNYASWNAPFSFTNYLTGKVDATYKDLNGKIVWDKAWANVNTNVKNVTAHSEIELKGPAIQFASKKNKWGFALGVNNKTYGSIIDASEFAMRGIVQWKETIYGILGASNQLKFMTSNNNEYYATIAYVLNQSDENFMKLGVSLKFINSNMNLIANDNNSNFVVSRDALGNHYVSMGSLDGNYYAAENANFGLNSKWFLSQFSNFKAIGMGAGLDLGFVYEFRPDFDKYDYRDKGVLKYDATVNKYQYKVAFSLLDIGKIFYNDPSQVQSAIVNSITSTDFAYNAWDGVNTPLEFANVIKNTYKIPVTDIGSKYNIFLPMKAVIHADYKVFEGFYLGAILRQAIPLNKMQIKSASTFSVLPRFEKKWFEFSLPIVIDNNYKNASIGAFARAGVFYLGSNNLGGVLNMFNPKGYNLYGGMYIPFYHTKPQKITDCPSGVYKPKKKLFGKRK